MSLTVEARFLAAFAALQALYSDERVEEYLAGGIEDTAVSLAADFGYTVDHLGSLHRTPDHNDDQDDISRQQHPAKGTAK